MQQDRVAPRSSIVGVHRPTPHCLIIYLQRPGGAAVMARAVRVHPLPPASDAEGQALLDAIEQFALRRLPPV